MSGQLDTFANMFDGTGDSYSLPSSSLRTSFIRRITLLANAFIGMSGASQPDNRFYSQNVLDIEPNYTL